MKKILLSIATVAVTLVSTAQTADFETPAFNQADSAWYGQNQTTYGDTVYTMENYHFSVSYDTSSWGGYWSGIAISSFSDGTTAGFGNQYSAKTGTGVSNSAQYGVSFGSGNKVMLENEDVIQSFEVTNTSYAYFSMKDGDAFAKAFGADTLPNGADTTFDGSPVTGEDWFLLTVYALNADSSRNGQTVEFYLADYRFADDNDDYIIDTWETVDLSTLGSVHGIEFELTSSDVGQWGMNTPNYFALDNITTTASIANTESIEDVTIYPNPSNGVVYFNNQNFENVSVFGLNGQLVHQANIISGNNTLNLSHLEKGVYVVKMIGNNKIATNQIIIK